MSDHWNRKLGSTVSLYTYTNADEVELLVNGKSLGRKVNDKSNPKVRNKISWDDVKYEPGRIEAVAYNDGKPIARHLIETADEAVALKASPDNIEWKADGIDLQHVRIAAVDKKGGRVQGTDAEVNFTVSGPAEIVGVINGDITSNELTVGNSRKLYKGTITVILRSKRQSGKVILTSKAGGLKPSVIKLRTE